MPPKKSKILKEKVTSEKIYEFLTKEQIDAREKKYANHITNLKDCLNYVNESSNIVAEINEKQLLCNKWQDYVNCCPLPEAYIPPDIRLSMEKLKYFENISKQNTIHWLLSIDERSILTQNLFRKDLTHCTLRAKNKKNYGEEYNRDIEFCLNILKRIDDFLDNHIEVAKCCMDKLNDVKKLRNSLQQEIAEFFNRFTYRVLCSEVAYMNPLDPITMDYSYQAENFQMHIWSLKNVPICFKQLEEPRLIANFHGVKINLHIPTFMMHANFTLRALHMNFDLISENAKSFSKEISRPPDTKSAGVQDLTDCMSNEWLMQLEIQNRVRNELIDKRQEHEHKLKLFEEQEEKKSKQKDEEKKGSSKSNKPKIAKPTYEPPRIEDDMFPDITEDFLKEEQKQYEDFINSIYNPKSLDLEADEINLKQYFILGGIYQLYEVQKPQHFDFNSFNMTWHYNNSKLVIDEHVHIPLYAKLYQRRSRVFKSVTGRSLSLKLDEFKDTDPHCPWFVLTIQLPEHLCYWGKPVVCHYETVTKFIQNTVIPIEINKTSKKLTRPQILTEQTLDLVTKPATKYLPFLHPQKGGLSDSILKLQHPSQESFSRTSLSNVRIGGKDWEIQNYARDFEGVLNIRDFPITKALNIAQIRHMHRHIIPRMISSFKFPKEIQEDELKASQHKSKSKAGLLKRKRSDVNREPSAENKRIFTFGLMQSNPERIIALFPPDEPIRIIQHDVTEETATDSIKKPMSFALLVKLINFIKWLYKLRVRKIMDLKSFKSKFPIANKRREDLRKPKLKPSVSMSSLRSAHLSRSRLHTIKSFHKKSTGSKPSESIIINTTLNDTSSESHTTECEQEDFQTCTYSHWTTEHILKSEYNREKRTVVLQTNRLGYFGFAFKRYEHFPFKFWKLEPDLNDPENKIIFTLDTQYVRCVLYITDKGIKGHVTELTTKFIRNPKMYLVIEEAMDDFKEFKKIFKEKYLNIFADKDARFYIENGYFSEKHLSTELQTYNCMAVNSNQMKFSFSPWNRLAQRREIILKFLQHQESDDNTVEVRITPEEAYFVETSELCSDNIDIIKLHYNLTWRNINIYSDLHHLINSMYPAANELRCKNANLLTYLKNLLYEIRPLSFS